MQVRIPVSAERDAPIVAGRMIYGTQTTQITVDCIYFQSLGLEETTEVGDQCGRQVKQAATATSQKATEVDRRGQVNIRGAYLSHLPLVGGALLNVGKHITN